MSQQRKRKKTPKDNRSNRGIIKYMTKENYVQPNGKTKKSFNVNCKVIIEFLLLLTVCGIILYNIWQRFPVVLFGFVCFYLILIIVEVVKYCLVESYNDLWFVGKIAKKCAEIYGIQHESCSTKVHRFFILIDSLITGLLFCALVFEKNYLMGANNVEHALLNYVLFIGSSFLIHMWIYMAVKFCTGAREVNDYFSDKLQDDNDKVYRDIWNEEKRMMNPLPVKCASWFEYIVKVIYLLMWLGIIVLTYEFMTKLGFYPFDKIHLCVNDIKIFLNVKYLKDNNEILFTSIGFIFILIGFFLNYFSYFMCITFTHFIRNVANSAQLLKFNHKKPSNTRGFRKLVHASSRVAIAFFVIRLYMC